jgi:hypothetical protein
MQLPIGYDNFREVVENELDFVDKSLFIQEVLDDRTTKAAVIVRPRRFGKTLNLSMLHEFLTDRTQGRPTKALFKGLKILKAGDQYLEHQGKYPVIFLTFKDIRESNIKAAYEKLNELMVKTFGTFHYLETSDKLPAYQKKLYQTVLSGNANQAQLENALQTLTECLAQYHDIAPWLLIDEYDTPIQAAYTNGYYEPMINLMRNLLGAALKTNPCLHRAVITGILRVAKESLFSGVNNLKVYSLLHSRYSKHFGFTEEEVVLLAEKMGLANQLPDIKAWYNGYEVGETTLYNPWSITNCMQEKGTLVPYWVNTSDNQLIRNLLVRSSTQFKEQFELLLQDKPIQRLIDENIVFGDLDRNESAAWSLLFMAGYLKVISKQHTNQGALCTLSIPNQEVRNLYRQIIEQWLGNGYGVEWYNNFLGYLLSGNMEEFKQELTKLMERTLSYHDMASDPEAFYHGFMIGLTASLSHNENYELQSNRESGYGRFDYFIFSRDRTKPSLLLEFKKVAAYKDLEKLELHLQEAAKDSLMQIKKQRYLAEAEKRGSINNLMVSVAFSGKRFHLEYEHIKPALLDNKPGNSV